jgi:hypothetical protein
VAEASPGVFLLYFVEFAVNLNGLIAIPRVLPLTHCDA